MNFKHIMCLSFRNHNFFLKNSLHIDCVVGIDYIAAVGYVIIDYSMQMTDIVAVGYVTL